MSIRIGVMALVGTILLSSVLLAKHGIVKTRGGLTYEGDIKEVEDGITVTVKGITTTIPRNQIDGEILYVENVEQQFNDRLKALPDDDPAAAIQLARWAFDAKRYDLARTALDRALEIDPNNAEAVEMHQLISRQRDIDRKSQGDVRERPPTTRRGEDAAPDGDTTRRPARGQLLDNDQINMIRLLELTDRDRNIRVRFEGDVRRRFAEDMGLRYAEFQRPPEIEQVRSILRDGDERMRQQVRILTDPQSIVEFRRQVQPMILNGCASAQCHGSTGAGGFMLHNPADSDAATYTNFYILQKYPLTTVQAEGGEAGYAMIDRLRPDSSLLIEFGLPREDARAKHPQVPGFRPMLRNLRDPRYDTLLRWIGRTLSPVEPAYGFDIPTRLGDPAPAPARDDAEPATRPATRPAGERH
jgi:tetratricopeptide (TPR) repeat protein